MTNTMRYMDWNKALEICASHPNAAIEAGLAEDWLWTGGLVYQDGVFCHEYVFTSSYWATPVLYVDGEVIECWTYEKQSTKLPCWWGRTYVNRREG